MSSRTQSNKKALIIYQIIIFAFLGVLMYCSKLFMEVLPNIHLLGMFTVCFTLAYRRKALFPIYVYVFLNGLLCGFDAWWYPYLYIWTLLWGVTMLLPKNISYKALAIICPIICALHGFAFGTLYAPAQMLMWHLTFEQTIAWIISGLYFDLIHGIGNFATGFLVVPLLQLIRKLDPTLKNKT
ncbi:MAG: hypothetical protein J6L23_00110 [Clostridia bacterium]|nr:hypothetical protein [Clostridia bacterium]MBQ6906140.1 hypothetical protein [Clostridia bacterium]